MWSYLHNGICLGVKHTNMGVISSLLTPEALARLVISCYISCSIGQKKVGSFIFVFQGAEPNGQ